MMPSNKKLLSVYGLKWNPFLPEVPVEGLYRTPQLESFGWRVENLILDGGVAVVAGDPGMGKSVALRLMDDRFSRIKEITVTCLDRPQSGIGDFYREMGECFGVELRASNRWGGHKALREKWRRHIETTLFRPVLLIDEAQEVRTEVLSELRLLVSEKYDSRRLLTVVLAGDSRLKERMEKPELAPLRSRVRSRLDLEPMSTDELMKLLNHALESAGNKQLITSGLKTALVEHAAGNPRVMMQTADELLCRALAEERPHLDEKLFFELVGEKLPRPRPGKR